MIILEVNAVPYGSTGRIAKEIQECAKLNGHEAYFAYSWTKARHGVVGLNEILIGNFFSRLFHMTISRFTNLDGFLSRKATAKFIKEIERIKPDIIHLHILHSFFIDVELLFNYLKRTEIKVVWTFHDCWSFTGGCMHFLMSGCKEWKNGCIDCPIIRKIAPLYHSSPEKTLRKKASISKNTKIHIVTPSKWMAEIASQSIFKGQSITVINNGIDLDFFHPNQGCVREKYGLQNKKVILGVAFGWSEKKGLDIFIELASRLDDNYAVVLVGTDETTDKMLPKNVISIHRTNNQNELVSLYSAADVFANPTREDTFPTVNIEALACGTPVVTFDSGGSPEIIDENCGIVIDSGEVIEFERAVKFVCEFSPFSEYNCRSRALSYDKSMKYSEYVHLFERILKGR